MIDHHLARNKRTARNFLLGLKEFVLVSAGAVTFSIGPEVESPCPGGEGSSSSGNEPGSWNCVWKCRTATPVHLMSFSPDGTLFATTGLNDRLVKIWFENKQRKLNFSSHNSRSQNISIIFPLFFKIFLLLIFLSVPSTQHGSSEFWSVDTERQLQFRLRGSSTRSHTSLLAKNEQVHAKVSKFLPSSKAQGKSPTLIPHVQPIVQIFVEHIGILFFKDCLLYIAKNLI